MIDTVVAIVALGLAVGAPVVAFRSCGGDACAGAGAVVVMVTAPSVLVHLGYGASAATGFRKVALCEEANANAAEFHGRSP